MNEDYSIERPKLDCVTRAWQKWFLRAVGVAVIVFVLFILAINVPVIIRLMRGPGVTAKTSQPETMEEEPKSKEGSP